MGKRKEKTMETSKCHSKETQAPSVDLHHLWLMLLPQRHACACCPKPQETKS